jgi:hypothetical protein
LMRNCEVRIVFPVPGPPTRRMTLPRGKPPPKISSNPGIPVGVRSIIGILSSYTPRSISQSPFRSVSSYLSLYPVTIALLLHYFVTRPLQQQLRPSLAIQSIGYHQAQTLDKISRTGTSSKTRGYYWRTESHKKSAHNTTTHNYNHHLNFRHLARFPLVAIRSLRFFDSQDLELGHSRLRAFFLAMC